MTLFEKLAAATSEEDIARGWQLWEVRTNCNVSYAMPENAMLASNWWVRGAYEDVKKIGLGGLEWRFPFGSNSYKSAWAFSWGKVRFELSNTNTEIVAVGAPMSAVPYRSRLWSAADTNDSRFITWENFALNRDTNTPVNAQIELRTTGDFVTRSNEVETVYRRVDPDDWDDDGWRNDDDPDPYVWEEYWDSFWQELPEGANESAYCWIEVRPRWHSYIEFVGDGPSDLDDPYLWAKAGETYRVQLLIGKTYTIVSSQPVEVVGRSSSSIEIDGNGTGEIEVVWPVTFSALEGNGSSFMMRVVPAGLGGTFTWTQHCCGLTGYGNQFWWAHERYCSCGGCYAYGYYSYEGYEKECTGGHCCCPRYDDDDPYEPQEDDGPYAAGASVEFSESVVIFEDAYTNMPGEVVARQSTQTTLTCIAHGGETGGTATFSIENGNKLIACSGGSLPVTRFVPPLQKVEFEIVYEGKLPSGSEEDIVAKADFTERGTGTRHSTQRDWLTSVKVELEAVDEAQDNPCMNRHMYGVHEWVKYRHYPTDVNVELTIVGAEQDLVSSSDRFFCPWTGGTYWLHFQALGETYETDIDVYEPEVVCREVWWNQIGVSGQSGLLDMRLALYIEPTFVSFKDLNMEEIPDDEACPHSGYFSTGDVAKTGALSHTRAARAGIWSAVRLDTSWVVDKASRETPYPQPWSDGMKEWRIPVGWGDYNGNVKGQVLPNPTTQLFTIDSSGTATIRKYNHEIRRATNNDVWLDGVLQED